MEEEGQEPTTTDAPSPQAGVRDYEAELKKANAEAAKWRVQYRDATGKLKELEPAAARLAELEESQKTEGQKLLEQIAQLKAQAEAAQAAAARSEAERKLALFASKAGVPAEALPYLDATKFDLDDEAATLEALAVLAASNRAVTPTVGASNPARGQNGGSSVEEWYKQRMAGGSSIFSNGG